MNSNNKNFFNKLVSKTKIYIVIIAILLIIICIIKPSFSTAAVILYILIMAYTYWTNRKRMAEVSEHISNLTLNVDKVSKRTLINSPFPLIIIETDGNVIWKSTKFIKEFNEVDSDFLDEIIKEIKLEIQNNDNIKDNQITKTCTIGNKEYKILCVYINTEKEICL